ncbi:hypothetical protein ATI61_11425 [Archangium gephyra]|uniref:Uncharacterized protein n=1 Tax=Archangium gephyra TaxID=48 RepID=A0ABX9JQB9_9BACT|nr:hypothetical protein [Archangium gephyra]REG24417.1 hypothetical protein ATI61_11425 [Archangium gephyra]
MTEETEEGSDRNAISLDLELSTLGDATRAAQMLSDLQARRGLMDQDMEDDTPMCIFSVLALVVARINHMRRVLRGEDSPENIAAPHNEVLTPRLTSDVEGDVLLFNYDGFRGSLAVGKGAVWRTIEEKAERTRKARQRKVKEPKGKGKEVKGKEVKGKEPKGKEVKGQKAKGRKPKRSLAVVRGGAPKDPPPSAPAST